MEVLRDQLPLALAALWWPFCRILAMFSASPVVGDTSMPVTPRILLSVALGVVMMPIAKPAVAIDPLSMHALIATLGEVVIGLQIGLGFRLVMTVADVLGFTVSSQMGLSMGVMNDPINGTSSDAVSGFLSVLYILLFFCVDGHLVLVGVVGASFHAWPVGALPDFATLQYLVYHVSWVFSAALLLAIPVMFSMLVVQIAFGFLNRVAPALNLYSLGFSAVILFGLFMLSHLVRFIPEHYVRMTDQVLELLRQAMS